jgi:hypothetical protein
MRFVRVHYDAYNRQFNLADHEMARELEDGATYLIADSTPEDFIPPEELERLGDIQLSP